MRHPGDPTPRSAREILADRGYKMVASEQASPLGGQPTNVLVVMHGGSETYWATSYPTSAPDVATTWLRVEPVVETRTSYRPVSS